MTPQACLVKWGGRTSPEEQRDAERVGFISSAMDGLKVRLDVTIDHPAPAGIFAVCYGSEHAWLPIRLLTLRGPAIQAR